MTVNVIGTHDDSPRDPALVASSHDLLLISSSIRLLDQAVARYAQTTTPLIFWEPQLLAATRVPLSPWGGTRPEQTDIRIIGADHPITAGMSTDQPLRVASRPDTFSVAYPPSGPGVQVLARHLTGDDAAIMVAEAGAELAQWTTGPVPGPSSGSGITTRFTRARARQSASSTRQWIGHSAFPLTIALEPAVLSAVPIVLPEHLIHSVTCTCCG